MTGTIRDALLVLLLVCVSGVFAAAEMALVSLRESQIRGMAARGKRGQRVAALAEDPNRFLSAVQIGVTLAGFLSAAFGGATLAEKLSPVLEGWGVPAPGTVALLIVTAIISYVSIVLGELAAKRLALQRSEVFALALAPLVDRISRIFRPVIWLLSRSTDVVVRLLGGRAEAGRDEITEEELRDLVAAHQTLGADERRLIEEVFAAGERQVHEVMVPRTEVAFLDVAMPVMKAVKIVADLPHSRYPVVRNTPDDVVGFVHVRDLLAPTVSATSTRVGELVRPVSVLPGTKQLLPALSEMRREGQHLAIVLDEYGGTDGIVTLEDLVEELVGEITDEYDVEHEATTALRGGVVEVDGLLNLDDLEERTGLRLPDGPYETVAGFVMNSLGRVPGLGDEVDAEGHLFTVTELDGRRVARLRISPRTDPRTDVRTDAPVDPATPAPTTPTADPLGG